MSQDPAFTALASRTSAAARYATEGVAATLNPNSGLDAQDTLNAMSAGLLAYAVEVHIRSKLTLGQRPDVCRAQLLNEVRYYFDQLVEGAKVDKLAMKPAPLSN